MRGHAGRTIRRCRAIERNRRKWSENERSGQEIRTEKRAVGRIKLQRIVKVREVKRVQETKLVRDMPRRSEVGCRHNTPSEYRTRGRIIPQIRACFTSGKCLAVAEHVRVTAGVAEPR